MKIGIASRGHFLPNPKRPKLIAIVPIIAHCRIGIGWMRDLDWRRYGPHSRLRITDSDLGREGCPGRRPSPRKSGTN